MKKQMVCITNEKAALTVGKSYVVLDEDAHESGAGYVFLIDDEGRKKWYSALRFTAPDSSDTEERLRAALSTVESMKASLGRLTEQRRLPRGPAYR